MAAAALAVAPAAANSASSLSVASTAGARVGADTAEASELRGNRSASMVIGFVLLVAILAIVLSNGEGPDSP